MGTRHCELDGGLAGPLDDAEGSTSTEGTNDEVCLCTCVDRRCDGQQTAQDDTGPCAESYCILQPMRAGNESEWWTGSR